MKYCKTCLQTDTRPNTKFNEDGICPACEYFEQTKDINWKEREDELKYVVEFGKQNSSSGYDCIIGVSGGKDSTRQALYVKNVLKMNPLLVCLSYPPSQVTQRGVDNISMLIKHGFDCITIQPSPIIWQKLMKKGFLDYTNWAKSTEYALYSSVPRLAIAYQIPLIWWGENPALQLGDLKTKGKTGADGNNLKHMNTLGGGDITWMIREDISKNQLLQYIYPSDEEMEKANLRIVFLGYFWNDWSLINNGNYSALRGLDVRQEAPENIGEPYGVTALDEDWVSLNQMIKYYKFGFGRTTDYMNEEIRLGRVTRDEAISITQKYDGTCSPESIKSFCDFLEITVEEFWIQVDKSVNTALFERDFSGKWIPKFEVGKGL